MISLMKQLFMKISYIPMLMLLKKEIAIEAVAVGRNLHKILLINQIKSICINLFGNQN